MILPGTFYPVFMLFNLLLSDPFFQNNNILNVLLSRRTTATTTNTHSSIFPNRYSIHGFEVYVFFTATQKVFPRTNKNAHTQTMQGTSINTIFIHLLSGIYCTHVGLFYRINNVKSQGLYCE